MNDKSLSNRLASKNLSRRKSIGEIPYPKIMNLFEKGATKKLEGLLGGSEINEVVDEYEDMLQELYFSRNAPHKFQYQNADEIPAYRDFKKELFRGMPLWQTGSWVYFPWNGKIVHFLEPKLHEELRTSRNKGLIVHEEQERYRKFKLGVAGLSIGQSIAYTIAVSGGCEEMHLADLDVISATNTNRMRVGFDDIGINKAIYLARIIYEINPYAKLKLFIDGLTNDNMEVFFSGLDAIVDEIDHFPTKLKIREEARKRKIPVVMAADVADAVGLDVERYDLDPSQELFNGKLDKEELDVMKSDSFKFEDMARIFIKMNGGEKAPKRLLESVPLIGTTLAGPPQLGGTAFLSGAVVAYIIRKLACGEKLPSCSVMIDLEAHLLKKEETKDTK